MSKYEGTGCDFCNPSDLSKRLVCEYEDSYLVSDAYPVTAGHLLMLSKEHLLSFGEMRLDALSRLQGEIIKISEALRGIKSKLIVFEHGNQNVNKSGKPSVDHAHIHLIPTSDLQRHLPASKKRGVFLDLPHYLSQHSYYFYWDVVNNISYWGNASEIESQFIRKIVAREENLTSWDWRKSNFPVDLVTEQTCLVRALLAKAKGGCRGK